MAGQSNIKKFLIQFSYVAKIPMLIIKSMGNAKNIINSVFTIFFIPPPALNDNIGYKTKVIDGVPHWSPRGADTWSPFSSSSISGCTLLNRKLSTSQNGTYTRLSESDYEFVLCRWRSYNNLPNNLEQIFLANSSLFAGGETTYVAIYKLKVGESISMSNFGEIWGFDF